MKFLDNHNSQSASIFISGTTNLYTMQTVFGLTIELGNQPEKGVQCTFRSTAEDEPRAT